MDYTCNFLYFHAPFIIIELIKSFVTFVLPCLTPTLKYKYYFLFIYCIFMALSEIINVMELTM